MLGTEKPKIVLVVGMHPNETAITSFFAKQLMPMLEERGFQVESYTIPIEETWQRKLALEEQAKESNEESIKNTIRKKYPGYYVFDLHAFNPRMYKVPKRQPKRMKIRLEAYFTKSYSPYVLPQILQRNQHEYVIEFGAMWKASPKKIREIGKKHPPEIGSYLMHEVNLKRSNSANLTSGIITRKVAHLIDHVVKTREGIYHTPRREMYKQTRKPKGERPAWRPKVK